MLWHSLFLLWELSKLVEQNRSRPNGDLLLPRGAEPSTPRLHDATVWAPHRSRRDKDLRKFGIVQYAVTRDLFLR